MISDFITIFGIFINKFISEFKRELGKISVIIQILIPVILAYLSKDMFITIICSMALVFVASYIKAVYRHINGIDASGMPVPLNRFTIKENGVIRISEGSLQGALQYLYELENYLEDNEEL